MLIEAVLHGRAAACKLRSAASSKEFSRRETSKLILSLQLCCCSLRQFYQLPSSLEFHVSHPTVVTCPAGGTPRARAICKILQNYVQSIVENVLNGCIHHNLWPQMSVSALACRHRDRLEHIHTTSGSLPAGIHSSYSFFNSAWPS